MATRLRTGLSPEEAALAMDVMKAFIRLRRVDPKMSIEEAYALLAVASKPGGASHEIAEALELDNYGMSRVMGGLFELGPKEVPGLGLVRATEDTMDRRRKLLHPTPRGTDLVRDVLNDIGEGFRHVGKKAGD